MLYCKTDQFAAICAGKAKMQQIDSETLTLAQELQPIVDAIEEEGEILLKVQHKWVSAIGTSVRRLRKKLKTVD
jgi:hypothetical protein